MGIEIYLIITLIFIILGALIAVETKNLLSAVIALGVVGFGLCIAFLFLRAPDLAIVQLAVEVVLLILLIRATINRELDSTSKHINWPSLIFIVLICIGLVTFGYFAFRSLTFGDPPSLAQGMPSATYLEKGIKDTGASNIVTSVILDYRAYDTLGEATVLFTSIIGALAILRGVAKKKKGGNK